MSTFYSDERQRVRVLISLIGVLAGGMYCVLNVIVFSVVVLQIFNPHPTLPPIGLTNPHISRNFNLTSDTWVAYGFYHWIQILLADLNFQLDPQSYPGYSGFLISLPSGYVSSFLPLAWLPLPIWVASCVYLWFEVNIASWFLQRRMTLDERQKEDLLSCETLVKVISELAPGIQVSLTRLAELSNYSVEKTLEYLKDIQLTQPMGTFLEKEQVFIPSVDSYITSDEEVGHCQICHREFSLREPSYQCSACYRFICTTCSAIGLTNCSYCKGELVSMPFFCNECKEMVFNLRRHQDHEKPKNSTSKD